VKGRKGSGRRLNLKKGPYKAAVTCQGESCRPDSPAKDKGEEDTAVDWNWLDHQEQERRKKRCEEREPNNGGWEEEKRDHRKSQGFKRKKSLEKGR